MEKEEEKDEITENFKYLRKSKIMEIFMQKYSVQEKTD